jgi:1-acyl-sn-glycerol-3-phosphate acyltransferase
MRTALALLTIVLVTPVLAVVVIVAALLRVPDRPGSIFDWAPRLWAGLVVRAAGVRLVLHGEERLQPFRPRVLAMNHVSWFDIFALASILQRYGFVAKEGLLRIPLFGRASRITGAIAMPRENRKAAFAAYEHAAVRIREGRSVVVCPEGTRGSTYALRPFKKGPFVLAIAAGVPVMPVAVYGTREVQRRGSFRIRAGIVHVHFLDPIETAGLAYDDRDAVARRCWIAIAEALRAHHGVDSPAPPVDRVRRDGDQRDAGQPAAIGG